MSYYQKAIVLQLCFRIFGFTFTIQKRLTRYIVYSVKIVKLWLVYCISHDISGFQPFYTGGPVKLKQMFTNRHQKLIMYI